MATRVEKEVELGFVEIPEDLQLLTSAHRPSKVGGKPAWLDQVHPPSPDDLACSSCGKPLTFLLQIYAPVPVDEAKPGGDEQPRTVFVFMCRDPSCHSKGASKCFKVFRCQLLAGENPSVINDVDESLVDKNLSSELGELSLDATKEGTITSRTSTISSSSKSFNGDQIYLSQDSLEEPTSSADSQKSGTHVYPLTQSHTSSPPLCIVCGCSGQKRCGKCTMAHYCSKEHQTHDWRSGHKNVCGELSSGKMTIGDLKYAPSKGVVLPEYEIVTELEPDLTLIGNGNPERSEEDRMADYRKFINSGRCVDSGKGGASGLSPKDLKDAAMSEHSTDKQFRTFKKRVAIEPEQVREGGGK